MAEQAIDAMDFPKSCRFPNCEHSAIKADMEVHELVCEHSLKECWWCNQTVPFDFHEDHMSRCHLNFQLRYTEVLQAFLGLTDEQVARLEEATRMNRPIPIRHAPESPN